MIIKKLLLTSFIIIGFINSSITSASDSDSKQRIMEEVIPKIEYALSCNSKWGSVSDITTTDMVVENNAVIIQGYYKQSLLIVGGEFNRLSGIFKATFDEDINLKRLSYKVSVKKGEVKNDCLS